MFPAANVQDTMSTDLSAFRRHGGKLIIWQGWADQAIPTYGTVDYYEDLAQRNGGYTSTQKFARMFLFPTVAIAAAGTHPAASTSCTPWSSGWRTGPLRARSRRPIRSTARRSLARYPYPEVPQYNGNNEPTNEASSFHPVVSTHANDYSNWIGNDLFYQPVGGGSPWSGNRREHRS